MIILHQMIVKILRKAGLLRVFIYLFEIEDYLFI